MNPLKQLPRSTRGTVVALWRFGGPVALQSLVAAMLGLVDTIMVSGLGPAALGGVGLVNRVLFLTTMVLAALASGTGALVAQSVGAGKIRAIRGPVTAAIAVGVLLTLPLALGALFAPHSIAGCLSTDAEVRHAAAVFLVWGAAYGPLTAVSLTLGATLRSLGDTRRPMLAGLTALAINTSLNFLFISGRWGLPALGISAAALATLTARLFEIGWLLLALKPHPLLRRVSSQYAGKVLSYTAPLMAKEIFWAGGTLVNFIIVARMGRLPLAALNLVSPVEGIMLSTFSGCGVASGILLGHALGRQDFKQAFDTARRLLDIVPAAATMLGLSAAGGLQLLRHSGWLRGLLPPELHDLALNALSVSFALMGARAHNMLVSLGILRSGGDTRWLMFADLASMWLVGVPLVLLAALVWKLSLPWVVGAMMMEEVWKVALFRHRVKGGRWLSKRV